MSLQFFAPFTDLLIACPSRRRRRKSVFASCPSSGLSRHFPILLITILPLRLRPPPTLPTLPYLPSPQPLLAGVPITAEPYLASVRHQSSSLRRPPPNTRYRRVPLRPSAWPVRGACADGSSLCQVSPLSLRLFLFLFWSRT